MTSARALGVSRPDPASDLDWSPDAAAALGHDAVELWREFLGELPTLPVQRDAAASDVAAAMAWDVPDGAAGSAANHDALVVARDLNAGWDVRRHGLAAGPRMTAYAPATVHDTVQRAADLVGMGHHAVRVAPVDASDHADVPAMRRAIEADVAAGHRPICVVGTGAIDDLAAIADLAEAFDLWFHVDGAVGAVGALVDPLGGAVTEPSPPPGDLRAVQRRDPTDADARQRCEAVRRRRGG